MSKLQYDKEIPAEILPVLQKHLEPIAWLCPDWCQTVHIMWDGNGSEERGAICSWCEYDYRRATLKFFPVWLTEDDNTRRWMVIHDMLHAFSGVLAEYAEETIKSLLPEGESPKFREHALRELTVRNESWVQDMAHCLNQKLYPSG